MDATEKLVAESGLAFAVLGNPTTGEHALIELSKPGEPLDESEVQAARDKGYEFCGVMGVRDGVADATCESNAGAWFVMTKAVATFAIYLSARLAPEGDGGDWLERLHALPDPRTDN